MNKFRVNIFNYRLGKKVWRTFDTKEEAQVFLDYLYFGPDASKIEEFCALTPENLQLA